VVKIMAPQYVKPFVRRQKNDTAGSRERGRARSPLLEPAGAHDQTERWFRLENCRDKNYCDAVDLNCPIGKTKEVLRGH
jgi:hypothetical protein